MVTTSRLGLTQDQIAEMLGCTSRMLRRYRDEGMPLDPSDIQCVKKCAIWIHENTNPQAGGWHSRKGSDDESQGVGARIKLAQLEKLQEEIREKRLNNERLEGSLIPAEEAEMVQIEVLSAFRQQMMQMGGKAASFVPGETKGVIKSMIDQEVISGLNKAFDFIKKRMPTDDDWIEFDDKEAESS